MPELLYASEAGIFAQEMTPTDLGLTDAVCDMQATVNTTYDSGLIRIGPFSRFLVALTTTTVGTGASTGTAAVLASLYAADGTTLLMTADQNLMTAINTKVNQVATAYWGWNITAAAINGTIGANVDSFILARYLKLTVEETQINNDTTSASVNVRFIMTR